MWGFQPEVRWFWFYTGCGSECENTSIKPIGITLTKFCRNISKYWRFWWISWYEMIYIEIVHFSFPHQSRCGKVPSGLLRVILRPSNDWWLMWCACDWSPECGLRTFSRMNLSGHRNRQHLHSGPFTFFRIQIGTERYFTCISEPDVTANFIYYNPDCKY